MNKDIKLLATFSPLKADGTRHEHVLKAFLVNRWIRESDIKAGVLAQSDKEGNVFMYKLYATTRLMTAIQEAEKTESGSAGACKALVSFQTVRYESDSEIQHIAIAKLYTPTRAQENRR